MIVENVLECASKTSLCKLDAPPPPKKKGEVGSKSDSCFVLSLVKTFQILPFWNLRGQS